MHMQHHSLLSWVQHGHAACLECPAQPADRVALQGEALPGGLVLAGARLGGASPDRRWADRPASEVQTGIAQVLRRGRDHLHRRNPLGFAVACGAHQLDREGLQQVTAQLQTPADKSCKVYKSEILGTTGLVHLAAWLLTPARG